MRVIYVSESDSLQSLNLGDLLDEFIKFNTNPTTLKNIVSDIEEQGFYTGLTPRGATAIIKQSLLTNLNKEKENGEK